jgi:hypothetical protein
MTLKVKPRIIQQNKIHFVLFNTNRMSSCIILTICNISMFLSQFVTQSCQKHVLIFITS